jgi:hypothetical protein
MRVAASHVGDDIGALNDGVLPKSSGDTSVPRFTWWPSRGTGEWVEYWFAEQRRISACEVYWYDDTGRGRIRVPVTWKIVYKDGDTWREVKGESEYGLWAVLQPHYSAGILEWRVGE